MEEAIKKADALIEALPYIQKFRGRPVVIKFGGSAMENDQVLDDVLEDVVFLATVGIRPVVVHGGGRQISEGMKRRGLRPRFVQGHRATDAETLKVVIEVLERVSAHIVERVEAHGGRAEPTFRQGKSLLRAARKLLHAGAARGEEALDIGFVGEVTSLERAGVLSMCAEGIVPVVPPIGQDDGGQLYNINADTAAAAIARELVAEKIVFLSDVHGIMSDPADPDSLLRTIDRDGIEKLITEGKIEGGMLPKVSACIEALEAGVRKAHIIDGRLPHSLLLEIFTDRGVGTEILG